MQYGWTEGHRRPADTLSPVWSFLWRVSFLFSLWLSLIAPYKSLEFTGQHLDAVKQGPTVCVCIFFSMVESHSCIVSLYEPLWASAATVISHTLGSLDFFHSDSTLCSSVILWEMTWRWWRADPRCCQTDPPASCRTHWDMPVNATGAVLKSTPPKPRQKEKIKQEISKTIH